MCWNFYTNIFFDPYVRPNLGHLISLFIKILAVAPVLATLGLDKLEFKDKI
ncbi:MAG: hypothetical protein LBP36_03095 [Oscillospiraceae bacterium]|nr:hypothetical protein [Oscillospiraceae bacterium]